jgi:hypothetical protein
MSESKNHHHPDEGPHAKADPDRVPYWKRAHRDWRFWVAVCFLFAAIAIYVLSVDLSLVPRVQRAQ